MSQADDYTVTLDANTRPYEQQMGSAVSPWVAVTADPICCSYGRVFASSVTV